jgi:quinol monooxygenase YgiN
MMLLQATAEVPDYDRFKDAVEWLTTDLDHPEGFLGLRVLRGVAEPNRVMFSEWWESPEAFETAFARYDMERRAEFLTRAGIDPASFTRALWVESDIPAIGREVGGPSRRPLR